MGCGWLGFPLARHFIKKDYQIKGSTTSDEKLKELSNKGIHAFKIALTEKEIFGDITAFLNDITTIIINIPPRLRKNNSESYVEKIKILLYHLENSQIENVIFISSTSVYSDVKYEVTENSIPFPEKESGKQLLEVEKLFQQNDNFKTTILRFSGLIDERRHPVTFLSGKKDIKNPDIPVNLIHLNDCIGIIDAIIEKNIWQEVFNAAYPSHPTRKAYYTQKAKSLNIPVPEFEDITTSKGKIIDSTKIKTHLNYTFTTHI